MKIHTIRIERTEANREAIINRYYNFLIKYEYFNNDNFKIRKPHYLTEENRKAEMVLARSIIAQFLRFRQFHTLQDIAYILKREQHGTIMNLFNRYQKKLADPKFTDLLLTIEKEFEQNF